MAQYYQELLHYLREVDEDIKKWQLPPAIKDLEVKTKVPRRYLVLGVFILIVLLHVFDWGGQLWSTLIGILYPCFKTYETLILFHHENLIQKALAKDGVSTHVQFWLTYWISFALLSLLDFFAYNILCWIPAFWLVKSVLLVLLYHPKTKGVELVRARLLQGTKPKTPVVLEEQVASRIAEGAAHLFHETASHLAKKSE